MEGLNVGCNIDGEVAKDGDLENMVDGLAEDSNVGRSEDLFEVG